MTITFLTLLKFMEIFSVSKLPLEEKERYFDFISISLNDLKISSIESVSAVLAMISVETGGLSRFDESFRYRKKTLERMFPGKELKTEEEIAEAMYSGRYGNTDPGDGLRYRGRGLIQLTFMSNYLEMSNRLKRSFHGIDLVKNPEIAKEPDVACRILVEFFKMKGIDTILKACDILFQMVRKFTTCETLEMFLIFTMTRIITGSTDSAAKRYAEYTCIKKILEGK